MSTVTCWSVCQPLYTALASSSCIPPGLLPAANQMSDDSLLSNLGGFWSKLTSTETKCLCDPWYELCAWTSCNNCLIVGNVTAAVQTSVQSFWTNYQTACAVSSPQNGTCPTNWLTQNNGIPFELDCKWPCSTSQEVCTFGNNVATCAPYSLDTWVWNDTALAPHFYGTLNSVSDSCTHVPLFDNTTTFTIQATANYTLSFPFTSSPDRPWDAWLGNCDSNTYCQKCPQGSPSCNSVCVPKLLAGETCSSTNQCFGNCLPNGKCDGPTSYPAGFNPPANAGNSSIGSISAQDSVDMFTNLFHILVIVLPVVGFVLLSVSGLCLWYCSNRKRAKIEDHATVLISDKEFAAEATNVNATPHSQKMINDEGINIIVVPIPEKEVENQGTNAVVEPISSGEEEVDMGDPM